MARIKWISHPTDPSLNGTEAHVSRSTADVLVAVGQAQHSPWRGYQDFLSSCHREGSDPSNSHPPMVQGVQWSCSALPKTGRPVIWRKSYGEVARIESEEQAIQYGAPESVLKQFRELQAVVNGAESAQASLERARREQHIRENEEKTKRAGVLWSRA